MKKLGILAGLFVVLTVRLAAEDARPVYENNFEKAELDKVPADFLVLDGAFEVKAEGGNKFLELPGAPLDTFGVLFGPTEKDGLAVSARIQGSGKGRRFPTFGVGLNGVGGFRLLVAPAKKLVELYKGDDVKATAPLEWQTGVWSKLKLQLRKVKDGEWKVEGKVWAETAKEPAAWTIAFDETAETPAGRPSIWGNPFSGTPIRFDDLAVTPVAK